MPFAATRMDLQIIILSKLEKDKYMVITYMWNLKNKTNEQTKLNRNSIINKKNKQAVARGKEVGEEDRKSVV